MTIKPGTTSIANGIYEEETQFEKRERSYRRGENWDFLFGCDIGWESFFISDEMTSQKRIIFCDFLHAAKSSLFYSKDELQLCSS